MKEVTANLRGKYIITSPNGCTVTQNAGKTTIYTEVPANVQTLVVAQTGELKISDDDAVVTEVFNLAPAPCRQGEGGGLPAGYKRVEWLEQPAENGFDVTGKTAYFNLGRLVVDLRVGDKIVLKTQHRIPFFPEEWKDGGVEGFCQSSGSAYFYLLNKNTRSIYFAGDGLNTHEFIKAFCFAIDGHALENSTWISGLDYIAYIRGLNLDTEWHVYTAEWTLEEFVWSVDKNTVRFKNGIRPDLNNLSVFGCPENNNGKTRPMQGRKKYFKVWINDRLVYDLVPCLDSVGAPCMFDIVSRNSYYNSGTGDFLYPGKEEEPATYSLRRPVTYAQLTEHGVRRLYKVPSGYNGTKGEYAMEHGFKPLVETEKPEEGYWVPQWRETDEEIVLDWIETEVPEQEEMTHEA